MFVSTIQYYTFDTEYVLVVFWLVGKHVCYTTAIIQCVRGCSGASQFTVFPCHTRWAGETAVAAAYFDTPLTIVSLIVCLCLEFSKVQSVFSTIL